MGKTYNYTVEVAVKPGWARVTSAALGRRDIRGTVGVDPVDTRRWRDPPHVSFGNLNVEDRNAVRRFIVTYGPPIADLMEIPEYDDQFEVNFTLVGYMKERVVRAWRDRDARALWFGACAEGLENYSLPLTWSRGGADVRVADCFTYLRLLLTRDLADGRARICRNPTCPAPYFIARRKDQTFCRWECANVVTQRNFRKRKKSRSKRRAHGRKKK
jgi:hypothetical protein